MNAARNAARRTAGRAMVAHAVALQAGDAVWCLALATVAQALYAL